LWNAGLPKIPRAVSGRTRGTSNGNASHGHKKMKNPSFGFVASGCCSCCSCCGGTPCHSTRVSICLPSSGKRKHCWYGCSTPPLTRDAFSFGSFAKEGRNPRVSQRVLLSGTRHLEHPKWWFALDFENQQTNLTRERAIQLCWDVPNP